jgi:hypothetical protein
MSRHRDRQMDIFSIYEEIKKRDPLCQSKLAFNRDYLAMSRIYFHTVGEKVSLRALRNLCIACQSRGWFDLARETMQLMIVTQAEPVEARRRPVRRVIAHEMHA